MASAGAAARSLDGDGVGGAEIGKQIASILASSLFPPSKVLERRSFRAPSGTPRAAAPEPRSVRRGALEQPCTAQAYVATPREAGGDSPALAAAGELRDAICALRRSLFTVFQALFLDRQKGTRRNQRPLDQKGGESLQSERREDLAPPRPAFPPLPRTRAGARRGGAAKHQALESAQPRSA